MEYVGFGIGREIQICFNEFGDGQFTKIWSILIDSDK